jgi:hypothetical protein
MAIEAGGYGVLITIARMLGRPCAKLGRNMGTWARIQISELFLICRRYPMNNSTKPLSESELAKQKVRAIYPDAVFYRGVEGCDSVILNTNKRPWFPISEPNNCGDAEASWIDAARRLPQPLSEDGIGSDTVTE